MPESDAVPDADALRSRKSRLPRSSGGSRTGDILANPYYDGPPSDHFDGTRFFLPGLPASDKSLVDVIKWKIRGGAATWPKSVLGARTARPDGRVDGLRITHVGHASYLIQVDGHNILVDPVWSERASPLSCLGPKRHNPPGIAFEDLPSIDAVLISHNHYDHLDTRTLSRIQTAHRARIYTPLGNDTIIRSATRDIAVRAGDWWDSFELAAGIRLTIVPAYHWSSRSLRDRRMALWGGFVVESAAGIIYCAGDTAYRDGAIFPQIRERFGAPLVAMLPIGAYAPRWFMKTQHANPDEAVTIANDCGARHVLGVHWGTFQLTDEQFDEPALGLDEAVRLKGNTAVTYRAFSPGDVWDAARSER